MPTISVWIPGLPVGQPRQRHTKTGRNYTPKDHPVQSFRACVGYTVTQEWQGGLWEGGVKLDVVAWFPRPKNKQWKSKLQVAYWHTSKPDADNILKAIQDALTHVLWNDDAQIVSATVSKCVCGAGQQVGVQLIARLLGSDDLGEIGLQTRA
jgi:Holliday junction resolvase RusA-like endonuclease